MSPYRYKSEHVNIVINIWDNQHILIVVHTEHLITIQSYNFNQNQNVTFFSFALFFKRKQVITNDLLLLMTNDYRQEETISGTFSFLSIPILLGQLKLPSQNKPVLVNRQVRTFE